MTGKAPGGTFRKLGGFRRKFPEGGLDFLKVALVWKFPDGILPKQTSKKFASEPPKVLRSPSRSNSMGMLVLALSYPKRGIGKRVQKTRPASGIGRIPSHQPPSVRQPLIENSDRKGLQKIVSLKITCSTSTCFRRFPMEPFLETLEGPLVPISAY